MDELLNVVVLVDDDDDVDDAMILHILNDNENIGHRAALYGRFNLDVMLNIECENLFRFHKEHIRRLAIALNIPEFIQINNVTTISGIDGLCILLRRFAYPNRLSDLEPLFGFSATIISHVANTVLVIIDENKSHLLDNLQNVPYLNYDKLMEYSQAIFQKGCPVDNCWGLIDGTARPICRPSVNQEVYYSGHKKQHCIKFQSVLCPDGIVISLKGAFPGRRHDAGIFRESGLYEELEQNVVFQDRRFFLYGDQAYGLRELLLRPYTKHEIQAGNNMERQYFNNQMRALRVSVEWGFGKIVQEFAFLDFKKNQKLLLQEVGRMYRVGTILTNCHTCLYGGETSLYFGVHPPVLEDYLGANI